MLCGNGPSGVRARGKILITYACNSFDFGKLVRNLAIHARSSVCSTALSDDAPTSKHNRFRKEVHNQRFPAI